jgi:pilus assembly protein CpaF
MVLMAGLPLPVRVLREYVSSAINIIIHVARLTDGTRKVLRVTEVVGMEEAVITTQDIFLFEQEGIDQQGRVVGVHRATGVRPKFTERLLRAGIDLGPEVFVPSRQRAVR